MILHMYIPPLVVNSEYFYCKF